MSRGCEEPHVTCEVCGYVWCLGEEPSRCDHGLPICSECWPQGCRECVILVEDGAIAW